MGVGWFAAGEADAWLGAHGSTVIVAHDASLAELYGLAAGRAPVQTTASEARVGQYL